MAFVDRVTNPRPSVGELDWGPKLDAYLAEVEQELENLELATATGPYAGNIYARASQTAALPTDLPANTLIIVPLDA